MRKLLSIDFVPAGSKLTFISFVGIGKISPFSKAIYKCECGNQKEINIGNVKSGKVVDCGCRVKEFGVNVTTHKLSKHPLFKVWIDMKTRCYNKNSWAYKYYGALGVVVCDEWRSDFKAFYDWAIANGWKKGLTIDKDKIPTNKGLVASVYSPDTCCFLTRSENCNHRKTNHHITFNGDTMNLSQWEAKLSLPKDRIFDRLYKGWAVEEALTTPVRKRKKV